MMAAEEDGQGGPRWRSSVEEDRGWLSEMRAVEWPEEEAVIKEEKVDEVLSQIEDEKLSVDIPPAVPQEAVVEQVVATAQVCVYQLNENESWSDVGNGDWMMLYLVEEATPKTKRLRIAVVDGVTGDILLASEVGADSELSFANSEGELTSEATSFGELCCGRSSLDGSELPYFGLRFGDSEQAMTFAESLRVAAKKVAVVIMTQAACKASVRHKIDTGAETRKALKAMGFDEESIEAAIARIGSDESADRVANAILEDALGGSTEEEFLMQRRLSAVTMSPSVSPKSTDSPVQEEEERESLIESSGVAESKESESRLGRKVLGGPRKPPEKPPPIPPSQAPSDYFFEEAAAHVEFTADQFELTAWAMVEEAARTSLISADTHVDDNQKTERAATAAARCARQLLFDGDASRDIFWACINQRAALYARRVIIQDRPKAMRESIENDVKKRVLPRSASNHESHDGSTLVSTAVPPAKSPSTTIGGTRGSAQRELPLQLYTPNTTIESISSPIANGSSSFPPPPPTPRQRPPEKNQTRFRTFAGVVTSIKKKIVPSPFRRKGKHRNSEDSILTPKTGEDRLGICHDAFRESAEEDEHNAQAHKRAMEEQVERAVRRASSDLGEISETRSSTNNTLFRQQSSSVASTPQNRRRNEMSRQPFTPDDFEALKILGRGSFGAVTLTRRLADGQVFAVKVLEKQRLAGQRAESMARLERDVLDQLSHARKMPFVARMRFAFHSVSKLYIAMDYFPHGSLHAVLRQDTPSHRYGRNAALLVCAELASALEHVHAACVVHRDLKPSNVLVDARGHVALSDFGLATRIAARHAPIRKRSFVGTIDYAAPELLLKSCTKYGQAVDCWALGCLTFEMGSGLPPFHAETTRETFARIVRAEPKFKAIRDLKPEAKNTLTLLLSKDPTRRLGHAGNFRSDSPWLDSLGQWGQRLAMLGGPLEPLIRDKLLREPKNKKDLNDPEAKALFEDTVEPNSPVARALLPHDHAFTGFSRPPSAAITARRIAPPSSSSQTSNATQSRGAAEVKHDSTVFV